MIPTTHGIEMDESTLVKKTGVDEDDRAKITWVEYYLGEELVHRSAHIELKHGLFSDLTQGAF